MTNVKRGLIAYLGPEGEKNVAAAMIAAEKVMARYHPDKLAQLWLDLLVRGVAERRSRSLSQSPGRIVLVVEKGDSLEDVDAVMTACLRQRLQLELVASLSAVTARQELLEICARHQLIPTVVEDPKSVCPHRLYGIDRLVVEDEDGEVAMTVRSWTRARYLSVEMCSLAQFREDLATDATPVRAAESARNPGSFAEWREPDGSASWVFVVHENNRGWILDGICREIGSRQPDSWHVAYRPPQLPVARNYWFSHLLLFLRYFRTEPERLANAKNFVWYSHPRRPSSTRRRSSSPARRTGTSGSAAAFRPSEAGWFSAAPIPSCSWVTSAERVSWASRPPFTSARILIGCSR
jgi:hypothetical protein